MSLKHEFKCDACKKTALASHNGEHHLPPTGWVQLWSVGMAQLLNSHLCNLCVPKDAVKKRKGAK